ncbi:hypothetical protein RKD18_000386 [Streptomyces phaeoluteigriseus]
MWIGDLPPRQIRWGVLRQGELAALASDAFEELRLKRRGLLAHQRVLDAVGARGAMEARGGVVLPWPIGKPVAVRRRTRSVSRRWSLPRLRPAKLRMPSYSNRSWGRRLRWSAPTAAWLADLSFLVDRGQQNSS